MLWEGDALRLRFSCIYAFTRVLRLTQSPGCSGDGAPTTAATTTSHPTHTQPPKAQQHALSWVARIAISRKAALLCCCCLSRNTYVIYVGRVDTTDTSRSCVCLSFALAGVCRACCARHRESVGYHSYVATIRRCAEKREVSSGDETTMTLFVLWWHWE